VADVLLERAFGEFVEMPGLRLTLPQAKRLWGLDERTCARLLERLVAFGLLCRAQSHYGRATDGRMTCPRPRDEESADDRRDPAHPADCRHPNTA
jgi:hypothetical protein